MEIDLEKWGDKLCWLVGVPLVALIGYFVWGMVLRPQRIAVVLPTVAPVRGAASGITVTPTVGAANERSSATPAASPTYTATPVPSPVSEGGAVGRREIVFEDHSDVWDWASVPDVDCENEANVWISRHEWADEVKSVKITLVDGEVEEELRHGPKGKERALVIGVGWPKASEYSALVYGGCVVKGGEAHCYVSPKQGSGEGLSAAASVAWAYALEDYFRPKTMEAWEEMSKDWDWSNYRPLVLREGDEWISWCKRLKRQK